MTNQKQEPLELPPNSKWTEGPTQHRLIISGAGEPYFEISKHGSRWFVPYCSQKMTYAWGAMLWGIEVERLRRWANAYYWVGLRRLVSYDKRYVRWNHKYENCKKLLHKAEAELVIWTAYAKGAIT